MSIAVVAAGCGGGGGGDDGSTAPSLSKAEFVKRANAVCKKQRADLIEEASSFERLRSGRKPRPYADMVHFVLLPTIEEELNRLEELGVPAGEEKYVGYILFTEQSALDSVATMPRVGSIEAAERHFIKSGKLFRAYGLSACAHPRHEQTNDKGA
jgi:hypothetical protein